MLFTSWLQTVCRRTISFPSRRHDRRRLTLPVRPQAERLEDRVVLSYSVNLNSIGELLITSDTGDANSLNADLGGTTPGSFLFFDPNITFNVVAAPPGTVAGHGTNQITVDAAAVSALIRIELGDRNDVATVVEVGAGPALAILGGPDNDRINAMAAGPRPVHLDGQEGNDQLIGGPGHDVMLGGPGNDLLVGFRGNDTMTGGDHDDEIIWNNGDGTDLVEGGTGSDTQTVNGSPTSGDNFEVGANGVRVLFRRTNLGLFSIDLDDVERMNVNSGGGGDVLTVNSLTGTDLATVNGYGGPGDDRFVLADGAALGTGTGVIDGGEGIDVLDYSAYTTPVRVDLGDEAPLRARLDGRQEVPPTLSSATGRATVVYDTLSSTIDVRLTVEGIPLAHVAAFHIHVAPVGVNGSVILDFLAAGVAFTPAGRNRLELHATDLPFPVLHEQALLSGNTYFNLHTPAIPTGAIRGQIEVAAFPGQATGTAGVANIENVTGGSQGDRLSGNSAANELSGGGGDDHVSGRAGSDVLHGGDGNNRLFGDDGDDMLTQLGSAAGDVRIFGGDGNNHVAVTGNIGGELLIENRDGLDTVRVSNSTVTGNLRIKNGDGGSDTQVSDSVILGDVRVSNRHGADVFVLDPSTVHGSVRVRHGDGASITEITAATIHADLSILTGDGDDDVDVTNSHVVGHTRIKTDGGDDSVTLTDSIFEGGVAAHGGTGDDTFAGNFFRATAALEGAQEVPPVTTLATGSASFVVDGRRALDFELRVADIVDVQAAHVHLAPAGVNGPVVVFLFGPHPGLTVTTEQVLAAGSLTDANLIPRPAVGFNATLPELIARMLAGGSYVNVHTVANPGGEIRGQISAQGSAYLGGAPRLSGFETATAGTLPLDDSSSAIDEFFGSSADAGPLDI